MPNKLNEQNTISISTSHPPNPTMVDASPQTLTPLPSPAGPSVAQPPPSPSPPKGFIAGLPRRPAVRVTSEYDSDTQLFLHKASCKLFEGFAKLKLSFQNNREGEISYPQIGFLTKYLSVLYDLEDRNALVKGSFDVGRLLQFKSTHDVKSGRIGEPNYLHLGSSTKCFSVSCTSNDNKSIVSCIYLGNILLFKYHHRKVKLQKDILTGSMHPSQHCHIVPGVLPVQY